MRRVTSMVFIGGWAGFFGTVSVATSLAIVSAGFPSATQLPLIGGEVRRVAELLLLHGNAAVLGAVLVAFLFASAALLLALSMWMLQGREQADRTAGEKLAIAALGCAAFVIACLGLTDMNLMTEDVSVAGLILVLALSVAALLFDRMIEVDEAAEAEEEGFYRNALLVGRQFGRDAAFQPASDESASEPRR